MRRACSPLTTPNEGGAEERRRGDGGERFAARPSRISGSAATVSAYPKCRLITEPGFTAASVRWVMAAGTRRLVVERVDVEPEHHGVAGVARPPRARCRTGGSCRRRSPTVGTGAGLAPVSRTSRSRVRVISSRIASGEIVANVGACRCGSASSWPSSMSFFGPGRVGLEPLADHERRDRHVAGPERCRAAGRRGRGRRRCGR